MFENVKNCGSGKFISNGEWTHPERMIDSHELIFVTQGDVYINENGKEYHLSPDEAIILQPNLRHFGYKPSKDTSFFWLHWYGHVDAINNIKHQKIENPYIISLYFKQLLDVRITNKPHESMDYLTRLILIDLHLNSKCTTENHTAKKIAAWIDANSHTAISVTQIATYFGYNTDYLNRLFKQSFSKTLKEYINEKRIQHIKGLMLRTNMTLKEISENSGFSEYKYFLKFFKYHEKITPTEFYKQYSNIHINSR